MMQLRLLGSFELRRIDGTRIALPGRQSIAIIACLGLAEGFSLARDRLADLVWAGRGEQADGSLRQELVRLRRAIGEDALPAGGTVSQPVTLNAEQIDIDVARFRSAAGASGGGSEALALYRGPLLEDFPLRPNEPLGEWFGRHRKRLHDIARAMMLRLLRSGEGSAALAERLIELDPLCEEGYRFLIRRFAAEGDLAGAQQRYEACATAFAAAGLPTSLEIRALMDDARAEIAGSSAGAFQLAHPSAAAQATHWLRSELGQPKPLRRPEARFVPEIADRPSIAVLPFDDLSDPSAARDPYLGDFVTEEITAALSRIPGLFVCARQSASAYRGVPKDARYRRRAWRALSRRRRNFAERQRLSLQRAPN
jgi:DNA-binding SARP family transcriptional activator